MVSRYMSDGGQCPPELGGNLFGKRTDKIEHERMGICASTKVSQDADNADQKGKQFLKVKKKHTNFCGQHIFKYFFSPSFYSRSHFTIFFIFTP